MHRKYLSCVPYKALEKFSKALYGTTGSTYSARVFRPVMHTLYSSGALPPPPPSGNYGAFAHVVSPGSGALANFIAARGLGISIPRGDTRAFDTCFRKIDEFIEKDKAFAKDWLVCQGLAMFLKVYFFNFRYFFITCKHMHINISDKMNYILFITVKTITE